MIDMIEKTDEKRWVVRCTYPGCDFKVGTFNEEGAMKTLNHHKRKAGHNSDPKAKRPRKRAKSKKQRN